MDSLKIIENDFIALFEGYPGILIPEQQHKMMTSTIGNLFDYLRMLEQRTKLRVVPKSNER